MSVYYPSTNYVSGIHTFSTLGDGSFTSLEGLNQRSQHPLLRCQQSNVSITGFMNVSEHLTVAKTIYASNLQILGDFVTLNTITSNTEQMVIENAGTGPALKVTQTGNNSVAEFYDKESGVALFVGNGGNVGIGTTNPQYKLHVDGDIFGNIRASETGNVISSGYVGELIGTLRSGTNGSTYSIRTTTNITSSYAVVCSQALNKGIYLFGFVSSFYASSSSFQVNCYITVGGTQVTNIMYQGSAANVYNGLSGGPIPIIITANSTTVALVMGTSLTTTAANHEMWIIRIN